MIYLVMGTTDSGKSAFAEDLVTGLGERRRYYLATMAAQDEDGINRIKKHREARKDKGFITIEKEDHISDALSGIEDTADAVVLLECVANLVGNELHNGKGRPWEKDPAGVNADAFVDVIMKDIEGLAARVSDMVIVTNKYTVSEEADSMTRLYVNLLDKVNEALTGYADRVYAPGRKITLVRHGRTKGNLEGRFVGRTDEPLLEESGSELKKYADPNVKMVYISSMLRAEQTAKILFPNAECIVIDELRECDFGDYEYKNHAELDGLIPYQRFIDSGGFEPFPGGEGRKDQTIRSLNAFERIMKAEDGNIDDIYIVAHGGTIMAIMENLVVPGREFYEWMCGNGEGYVIRLESKDHYTVCGVYP